MNNNQLLEMAEHYYQVAKDLKRSAEKQAEIAEMLNQHADRLCEANMRIATASSQPNESGATRDA